MRLSLKAKVLSLAVVPVLLFAVVISLTTVDPPGPGAQ